MTKLSGLPVFALLVSLAAPSGARAEAGRAEEVSYLEAYMDMLESGVLGGAANEEGGGGSSRVVVEVFKASAKTGLPHEFVLVAVDGTVDRVFVTSTGRQGKPTPEGEFPLTAYRHRGRKNKAKQPFPWITSDRYSNAPMYWGLNIWTAEYWIHSTSSYGKLGRPASAGCVRLSFPAAMELWELVVNRAGGAGTIRIHGAKTGKKALAAYGLDPGWLKDRIEKDLADAHAVAKVSYRGRGHARPGQELAFPSCGDVDCFTYFGIKRP